MVQRMVPNDDLRIGNWTTHTGAVTNLYQTIDEVTSNNADYVVSPDDPNNSVYVVGFREVVNPKTNQGHIFQWTHRNAGISAVSEVVELRQGYNNENHRGTLIRSWTINRVPQTFTTELRILPTWQASDITDYDDLSFRFLLDQTETGIDSQVHISWVYGEVPDVLTAESLRWKLIDPSTSLPWDEYEFPINPLEFAPPRRSARIAQETSLAPDGGLVLFQGRDNAKTGSFSGIINSRSMYNQLRTWLNKWYPLKLQTDNDYLYNILVTGYEIDRVRRANNQHRYDYSVEVIFL